MIMQTEKETQIGGPNTIVEIDETLITNRKYNQGRVLSENWVFGGICRQTKEIFIESVPDRKATNLIPLIEKHIITGTTIHSDKFLSSKPVFMVSSIEINDIFSSASNCGTFDLKLSYSDMNNVLVLVIKYFSL